MYEFLVTLVKMVKYRIFGFANQGCFMEDTYYQESETEEKKVFE